MPFNLVRIGAGLKREPQNLHRRSLGDWQPGTGDRRLATGDRGLAGTVWATGWWFMGILE